MTIDTIGFASGNAYAGVKESSVLMEGDEIKAILYLGIKGEVFLPEPERRVDLLA